MPNTFLIKDILNKNDDFTAATPVEFNNVLKRPLSPMFKHTKKIRSCENNIIDSHHNETFMNSLIAIANQQPQYSSLNLENTDLSLKSPYSSSSSSSLSSTSPTTGQFTHEQLVNQFYQRLLFLNLQNSLNRIQNNNSSTQGTSLPKQLSNNKENSSDQQEYYCDTSDNNSESEVSHQQENEDRIFRGTKFQPYNRFKNTNKSFSTSSLKLSSDLDESNSDRYSNGNCSTPVDHSNSILSNNNNNNNSSAVSPLDALLQMANTTFVNNNNNIMMIGKMMIDF